MSKELVDKLFENISKVCYGYTSYYHLINKEDLYRVIQDTIYEEDIIDIYIEETIEEINE